LKQFFPGTCMGMEVQWLSSLFWNALFLPG
jgi:hypothetical protein